MSPTYDDSYPQYGSLLNPQRRRTPHPQPTLYPEVNSNTIPNILPPRWTNDDLGSMTIPEQMYSDPVDYTYKDYRYQSMPSYPQYQQHSPQAAETMMIDQYEPMTPISPAEPFYSSYSTFQPELSHTSPSSSSASAHQSWGADLQRPRTSFSSASAHQSWGADLQRPRTSFQRILPASTNEPTQQRKNCRSISPEAKSVHLSAECKTAQAKQTPGSSQKAKKMHGCTFCSKSFCKKGDITRHVASVHRDLVPHVPEIWCTEEGCLRKTPFSRRDNFHDHLRRVHGAEIPKARRTGSIFRPSPLSYQGP